MPLEEPHDEDQATTGQSPEVSAVHQCKLPAFWKDNPEIWFLQAESVFHSFNVRSDNAKYHLIVSNLTPDALLAVSDIIKAPPSSGRYTHIKAQLINRLADSPDKQLHKVLSELELGGRKPSELLRLMRSMVGAQAPENVIRVRWLALLPPTVQKLLRVFQATATLDELATGADTLMESGESPQFIMSTASHRSHSVATPNTRATDDAVVAELKSIRAALENLSVQQNKLLENHDRGRSRSRGRSESHISPAGHCYFHHNFGSRARRCVQPCTFKAPAAPQQGGN